MKISRVQLFFIISLTLFFVAITTVALLAYRLSMRMNHLVLESNTNQLESTVGYILDRNKEDLRKVVFDYTYWDEFALFVDSKKTGWGEINLDPMITNFNLDGLWVFNLRRNIVYSKAREEYATLQTYKIPAEAFALLDKQAFLHYYEFTTNGFIEVQAATIHHSNDEAHQSLPSGYFFICRSWSKDNLIDLGKTLHSDVALLKAPTEVNSSRNRITVSKELSGLDGKPVAWLEVNKQFEKLNDYLNNSNLLLGHFFLIIILILVFTFWAFLLLVKKPLDIVKKSLDQGEPSLAKSLRNYGGPFVEIGEQLGHVHIKDKFQKEAIDEANELDSQKVTLLKDFSHRIRTPLGGLAGFAELLSQPGIDEAKRALYANQVRKSSMDLLNTIDGGWREFSGTDPEFYYSLKEKSEYPITFLQAQQQMRARNPGLVLIEDDPTMEFYIRECLGADTKLDCFTDASAAIEYLKKHKVSLILLDVQLSGKNDWQTAVTIRQLVPSIPLVIQTSFATASDRKKAAEIGCDDYLAKPYTPDELLSVILRNIPV
ncbi:MAG: response regulator [Bacteroidales bacterium]